MLPQCCFILIAFCLASVLHAETFSTWQSTHFTPAQLANPAISSAAANPDSDPFANLQEYAFALGPFTANNSHEALGLSLATPASTGLLFTYAQSKTANDLLYQIEYTDDLGNHLWNLLTDPQELEPPLDLGPVWQRSILVPSHYTSSQEFLRLRLHLAAAPGQPILLNDPPQQLSLALHPPFLDIDLRWIDRSNQETGYRIERRTDGTNSWINIATTAPDTRSHRDRHLAGDILYHYRVRAVLDNQSLGNPSAERTVATPLDSDSDNLSDTFETRIGTSPTNPDSDNDGLDDGYEIASGTRSYGYPDIGNGALETPSQPIEDENGNPTGGYTAGAPGDPYFDPSENDSNQNGTPDGEEDWNIDPAGNPAPDGLTNAEEYAIDTDPLDPDTDGDNKNDGNEAAPLDKFITLPRVPESHYAVLPIQETTDLIDKTFISDHGTVAWQQSSSSNSAPQVYFWQPTSPAPIQLTVASSSVTLKDLSPESTILLQSTFTATPSSANTEYPLEQNCQTTSTTWNAATGLQTQTTLKGSPLIVTILQKAEPLWQQMLAAHRQNVNDSITAKQGEIAAQDIILSSNADAAAKQIAAARKQTLQDQIARSQQHLTGLNATFDPIALAQETNIIGTGSCGIYPLGFGPAGSIIANYYETLILQGNGDFPFYVKLEHGGLCRGNNGSYSLYDPTSSDGSAKPTYLDLTLDGEYRTLTTAELSRMGSAETVNRSGLVYGRDKTTAGKSIAGNGTLQALHSAEGRISNTQQDNQPFPLVGVRLDYGESSIYRLEEGVWKEWTYGIFNEDHPAWISDRLEMLLTDTPSIWRNGRAVELAGLIGDDSPWQGLSPQAISPTSGMIYASATKTKNPDGSEIPQNQRKNYGVSLLPVEFKVNAKPYLDKNQKPLPIMGSVKDLLSVWSDGGAGTKLKIKIILPEGFPAGLPEHFIKWSATDYNQTVPENSAEWEFEWSGTSGRKVITIEMGGIKKLIHVDIPNVGTTTQFATSLGIKSTHEWVAIASYSQMADTWLDTLRGYSPAALNALKHSYWNAMGASSTTVGFERMQAFSTAHEFDNKRDDQQTIAQENGEDWPYMGAYNNTMDMHNNAVGLLTIHTTLVGAPDEAAIKRDLLEKLRDGRLMIWDGLGRWDSGDDKKTNRFLKKSNGKPIYED